MPPEFEPERVFAEQVVAVWAPTGMLYVRINSGHTAAIFAMDPKLAKGTMQLLARQIAQYEQHNGPIVINDGEPVLSPVDWKNLPPQDLPEIS